MAREINRGKLTCLAILAIAWLAPPPRVIEDRRGLKNNI